MTKFRKIGRNIDFWPKMDIFFAKMGQKWANGFFQVFFGQNHTAFSCKTSILRETVDQFDY